MIYYHAQKDALENESYYQLQHFADTQGRMIIESQMKEKKLKKLILPKGISLVLIDNQGKCVQGKKYFTFIPNKEGYFQVDDYNFFVSKSPMEHLNIIYVVVQSNTLSGKIYALKMQVSLVIIFIFILISLIAGVLSILFMRPMRQRVREIESFINNITHELNTPISALSMASKEAMKETKKVPIMLEHIAISTQQLYDIYRSLSYLSFHSTQEEAISLNIATVLEESIGHYKLLCERKKIALNYNIEEYSFTISKTQLQLIFSNLIGNAIKYSPPRSAIRLSLKNGLFTIEDEGIGIAEEKQKEIFKRFKRGTIYSGGFGVGLNIVENICTQYSINLTMQSTLDKGTGFYLDFAHSHR